MEDNIYTTIPGMTKAEFARRAGIAPSTLANYLNKRHYNVLVESCDYQKHSKFLTPKQVKVICKILVAVLDS